MAPTLEAFFRPQGDGGFRLYLHETTDRHDVGGALLLVHPWAEEMNKSRRVMARIAGELAAAGWATLRLDLAGCGDSSGDFGDATWHGWLDDVVAGAAWLHARHPDASLWLGGLRAGALLAVQAAPRLAQAPNLLVVQPVLQGKHQLQQFLRMADAGRWAGVATSTASASGLRAALDAGQAVDVAGYRLGPKLAAGLDRATLAPPDDGTPRGMVWIDVSSRPAADASPASLAMVDLWRQAGWRVAHEVASGPAFWQTTEIEEAPAVIGAVCRRLVRTPEVA
jgi:exosortase A-associated hydrolase 2